MPFLIAFLVLYIVATISTLLQNGIFAWVMGSFALCGLVAVTFVSVTFFVARAMKRYDLIDAAWGGAFMLVALTSFFLQPGDVWEFDAQMLVTFLVLVWGTRLSFHILRRISTSKQEDARYVELRKKWRGNEGLNVFIRIYLLQAILVLLIAIPVIHINLFADNGIDLLVLIGTLVWLCGFVIEAVADRQLQAFVSDPQNKGKLMTSGLWKYSRHPNYFGELTQWWGIFVICLTTPYGWVGVVGPVLLTYLIVFVSGIPLSEKRFEGRPGWADYKKRTSVLLPLPPQKG